MDMDGVDGIVIPDAIKPEFQAAREELGEAEYYARLGMVFHRPVQAHYVLVGRFGRLMRKHRQQHQRF